MLTRYRNTTKNMLVFIVSATLRHFLFASFTRADLVVRCWPTEASMLKAKVFHCSKLQSLVTSYKFPCFSNSETCPTGEVGIRKSENNKIKTN